ncbi:MAG: hypothetical protein ABH872_06385, partial [Candidatus Omnitrophota bacterium]
SDGHNCLLLVVFYQPYYTIVLDSIDGICNYFEQDDGELSDSPTVLFLLKFLKNRNVVPEIPGTNSGDLIPKK